MTKIFSRGRSDFYDDYAHHPTEIESILDGINNVYQDKKIVSVFEPHRYSRVLSLKKKFAKSFSKSHLVILCPLYAASEKKDFRYKDDEFAKLISKSSKTQVIVLKNYRELGRYFKKNLTDNQIIIGMGAGSISKYMQELKNIL